MYRKSQVTFLEGMSSTNQWCVPEDVQDALSVDFDRSLLGLEVDLCPSNNMNSTVFAVPEISVRKDDVHNNGSEKCQIECFPVSLVHGKKIRYSQLTDIDYTNSVKRFCFNKEMEHSENYQAARCRPHSLSVPELCSTSSHFYSSGSVINTILSQVVQVPVMSPNPNMDQVNQGPPPPFHCVLLAPTSISTKINEETLTYLNQGQPYEVRIKKNVSFLHDKNVLFKSVIHVGFQERRLQYMEKEQIKDWQAQRCSERILEIDFPLSYGILEAFNSPLDVNECGFLWDSNQDVGVFLKVNCISTEFTPKKHGGEKGVPFRIVIETYIHNQLNEKLHSASCQVKVFKPKGADRKHKTDREKMYKRLQNDREKYHPQYEYTIFRDLCLSDSWVVVPSTVSAFTSAGSSPTPSSPVSSCSPQTSPLEHFLDSPKKEYSDSFQANSSPGNREVSESTPNKITLSHDSSAADCMMWLQANMFGSYVKDFTNFTGADILNLTRADLIDICGAANGIRLFNTLHRKGYLTTYVRLTSQKAYSAIYLKTTKVLELASKVKSFCGLPTNYECEFYVSGPSGTRVIVTNEVVCNKLQDSLFVIEHIEGSGEEQACIILKQVVN